MLKEGLISDNYKLEDLEEELNSDQKYIFSFDLGLANPFWLCTDEDDDLEDLANMLRKKFGEDLEDPDFKDYTEVMQVFLDYLQVPFTAISMCDIGFADCSEVLVTVKNTKPMTVKELIDILGNDTPCGTDPLIDEDADGILDELYTTSEFKVISIV